MEEPRNMKLITEFNDSVSSTLVEAADTGKKHWIIEGIWMQANLKNRNGRVYPMEVLEREVDRYRKDYIDTSRAVGELGHPEGPSINPDRISHRILEMRRDGDNFVGRAQLLDTYHGVEAQKLLEGGVKYGVSSRGIGTLAANRQGIMEVQGDYYLATAGDIVMDPSAPSAFVNGIMEGVEWKRDSLGAFKQYESHVAEVVEETRANVDRAVRARVLTEENKVRIFERFLKRLG